MTDEPPTDVFASLPRARPHRRSAKRAPAKPAAGTTKPEPTAAKAKARAKPAATPPRPTRRPRPTPLRQPAQPGGTPTVPRPRKPPPVTGTEILGTAVQAAAELAEIGLSASARALRNAISRLPHP
jgi:hypothetical protein